MPRRTSVAALYSHARSIALVPTVVGGKTVSSRVLRAVLLAVANYLDPTDWAGAFPSMATLPDRAEVSVSTARRAVRALETIGILVVEIGGGRRSNRYRLVRSKPAEAPAGTANEFVENAAPARSQGPCSSVPGTDDSVVSTSPHSPFGRMRQHAAAHKRGRAVPDDLRPLADALAAKGLRAAYGLTAAQLAEVRAVVARAGVPAMVAAAYRAHRAADPARWWSAWVDLWVGLHVPAHTPAAPVSEPEGAPIGDPVVGAAACRAALTNRVDAAGPARADIGKAPRERSTTAGGPPPDVLAEFAVVRERTEAEATLRRTRWQGRCRPAGVARLVAGQNPDVASTRGGDL